MRRTDGPFPVWEIIPGRLYQRGKLHDMCLGRKARGVMFYGITHAVALAPPTPDPDLDLFVEYTHFPIADGVLKTGDALLEMAAELAEELRGDGCIMTMCNAGRNRSGLLSALILREYLGLSGVAALEHVRRHRPEALANWRFETWLRLLP